MFKFTPFKFLLVSSLKVSAEFKVEFKAEFKVTPEFKAEFKVASNFSLKLLKSLA
ncbi:hypothetical protein [Campylobacter troglodytis]|uniref:hypothetical protein n=1 Tax=Campylobacter troglodytis TaxID=654363 RepID=UPI00163C185E|nr:hypothetical protein [Campylobacter troglodytis]